MFELNQSLIKKYGEVSLYDIAAEEVCEFLQAINKIKRYGISHDRALNLAVKIAELEIVFSMLKEQFILDYDVNYFKVKKINHLNDLVKNKEESFINYLNKGNEK